MSGVHSAAAALLGKGQVRHQRLRPAANRFAYPTYFLMLPMRSLRAQPCAALNRNRFGLLSFHDRDHGDARPDALQWLEECLAQSGIHDADGEVWLHCFPRVLGHTFKPVSFWYCHRADGGLRAVLVEVNNTFGERHAYLLSGPDLAFGREVAADKVFHVSPFCETGGRYRFRFMRTDLPGRTVARIEHDDADGLLLRTSVSGSLLPLTPARARQAFFSMPFMTLGVVWRIHWQALKLWFKRVPYVSKPVAPKAFLSR